MEDSGIDSEDRQSTLCDDLNTPQSQTPTAGLINRPHMDDLDVIFRSAKSGPTIQDTTSTTTPSNSDDNHTARPPNTCRILQRKLELKVERAKRNYSQYREEQAKKSQTATLLPISRLPIPGNSERKPLVDYKSDDSDDAEEISFFPAKRRMTKAQRNAELTDTFSIREMTIESDEDGGGIDGDQSDDSDGSQNLELLPPLKRKSCLDSLKACFTSCTASMCS